MSRIWNITPYDPNKRLGKIHNDFCALIPDNDWILITDHDMMFLLPEQLAWIEQIANTTGKDYDLLGCMTNRVGIEEQCYFGQIDNSPNVTNHIRIAKQTYSVSGNDIVPTKLIAGFLMLFRKSLWNKIKFKEGINFDIKFCESVISQGGKIGIMKGIYVWHSYRLFADNSKYKLHLLNRG